MNPTDPTPGQPASPEPESSYPREGNFADWERIRSQASWITWGAVFSLVNFLVLAFNGSFSFIFAMGFAEILGYFVQKATLDVVKIILSVAALGLCGGLFYLGSQAKKAKSWAFITALVVFIIDTLLFFVDPVNSIPNILAHCVLIYIMVQGVALSKSIERSGAQLPGTPAS